VFSADDVQARLHERPFMPVRIITSSGQSHDVRHPDLVLVGRRFLIIGVASNENPTQIESASRVAIMHITDMQDIPHPAPVDTNGT